MKNKIIIPPYLNPGDAIGITCPAGYMSYESAQKCIESLQSWDYEVIVGKTLGSDSQNYFSAPDEERRNELQEMLDDKNIKAIIFGRGGYGMTRIIDGLSFKKFKKNPKWISGFSDITVMHCHLLARYNIASIHAPMAAAFQEGENLYTDFLKNTLTGTTQRYQCEGHPYNRPGTASGTLLGGNLALLAHLCGTKSMPSTKNALLFLEDVGEYSYNIDRMLYQLKRNGIFKNVAGIIIGGFTDTKDTERPFGKSTDDIIDDIIGHLGIPVCFNFPVSHNKENVPLKCGVTYKLNVGSSKSTLKETGS